MEDMSSPETPSAKNDRPAPGAIQAGGTEFVVHGRLCRIVRAREEWDTDIRNPLDIVRELRSQKVRADVFTFAQRVPETAPAFSFRMEMDNVAAVPLTTYDEWWKNQVNRRVRMKVRKSRERGVVVRQVGFSDDLVRGIAAIYNESPVRQGRRFWHYGKTFEETKAANATYMDRADFLGAYLNEELIGFIKLVYAKNFARTMGIMGKIAHRDDAPMNALLAKAVELCIEKKIPYLVYGKFQYGTKGVDTLADFKRYNGFQMMELPRYFLPLSPRGKILLALNLHHRVTEILPGWMMRPLLKLRKSIYDKRARAVPDPD
jgi:hypothetical protein